MKRDELIAFVETLDSFDVEDRQALLEIIREVAKISANEGEAAALAALAALSGTFLEARRERSGETGKPPIN